MINREYLRQLVEEVSAYNAEKEIFWQDNYDKRLAELSKNLGETIEYIDTCSQKELDWMSEVFDELSEHFRSQELIDCVERNITRFDDPELQEELRMELKYMKMHL